MGFADSFLHGRLGRLLLKHLVDHAYGPTKRLDAGLIYSLKAIALRQQEAKPRLVTAFECKQWLLYTGACFEQSTSNGGLGGVLANENTEVSAWFGLALDARTCNSLGAQPKGTTTYELELLAAVLAADLWYKDDSEALHVVFGDNDSVRFSLIRASANNVVGQSLVLDGPGIPSATGSGRWFENVVSTCTQ